MPSTMNRRQWLKFSSLTAAGLTLSRTCEAFPFELFPENILQNKNLVLLNQNENPYGISKKAEKAIVDAIRHSNRYPEDLMDELRSEIAKEEDVPKDHVMLAGGSTELYSIAGLVYGLGSKEILMASPTFFGFENYIRRIGSKMNLVPLDSDYKHDLNAMAKEVGSNTAMIYMCNPNNPTGTIVEGKKLRDFCESASKTAPVVVDEAYHYLVKDKKYS